MKPEGQVRQKLKQVLFRHRKAFLRENLQRRPENCAHSRHLHLPLHVSSRGSLRVCTLETPEGDWDPPVCDSSLGGDRQASQCPHYNCRASAEDLKAEFNERVGLGTRPLEIGRLAKDYPDIAALMWVLGLPDGAPSVFSLFGDAIEDEDSD